MSYRTILVPVDGSGAASRGLREALRLAKEQKARLVLVHVVDEYYTVVSPEMGAYAGDLMEALKKGGQKILERAAAAAAKAGVKARTVLREIVGGSAATEIVKEARKSRADVIVMGTHGRRGLRRLAMGSDAEHVVRESSVPVLLVRGK